MSPFVNPRDSYRLKSGPKPRPFCAGSQKSAIRIPGETIAALCPKCRNRFLLTEDGKVRPHKEPLT